MSLQLPTNTRDPFVEKYLEISEEDPPEVEFEYLKMIKISNFKDHSNEMRLVRFLLEKASSLESFVVVAPKELVGDEYNKRDPNARSDFLQYLQLKLSSIQKVPLRRQIILSDHDDNKFRPTHWDVYSTV